MQPHHTGTQRMRTLETLVMQMQANDDQAFAQILHETTPFVAKVARSTLYRYASRHALPATVADVLPDIIADVFVRLWEKRAGYTGPGSFYAWLRVVAEHVTVDFIRRHADVWVHERLLEDEQEGLLAAGAIRAFRDREMAELIRDAMQTLSPGEEAAVRLHYIMGYRYKDIAHLRGSTNATVRTLLQRARPKLRHYFQET